MDRKTAFFEDMARELETWGKTASEALTREDADLIWTEFPEAFGQVRQALQAAGVSPKQTRRVLDECFRGLAVSFLTIIDGGTKMAESGRVRLVDKNRASLGEGLHDDFVGHLLRAGRLEVGSSGDRS